MHKNAFVNHLLEFDDKNITGFVFCFLASIALIATGTILSNNGLCHDVYNYQIGGDIKQINIKKDNINTPCNRKENGSPILMVAETGNLELFEKSIDAGADLNVLNEFGEGVLHKAAQGGNPEIVKILLENFMVDLYHLDNKCKNAMDHAVYRQKNGFFNRQISDKQRMDTIEYLKNSGLNLMGNTTQCEKKNTIRTFINKMTNNLKIKFFNWKNKSYFD